VRFIVVASLLLALAAMGQGGCEGPSTPPYDRAALLRETAEIVILPGYEAVEADASALTAATVALCASPTLPALTGARDAWTTTFLDWQRTGAYQIGPTRDLNLGAEMAFWPTRPMTIEANLAAATEITPAWIDTLGAGGKGLYAIEYLLFGTADEATVLAQLTNARRCAYLTALADHVERTTGLIVDAWSPSGGDYVGTLATAGDPDNDVYISQLGAISTLMTAILNQLLLTKLTKLGVPLGRLDGLPQPGSIETLYADLSVEAMEANVEGARRVWSAAPHSLDGYLRSRRADVADTILAQFDASTAALTALPEPFGDYVSGSDHAAGDAAYERLREFERLISSDASAILGVSLMFVDSDGD
jgi:predicted lipoprotein